MANTYLTGLLPIAASSFLANSTSSSALPIATSVAEARAMLVLATTSNVQFAGLTLTDLLIGSASTTARATLRIPPGVAPTSPVDGDVWSTTAGVFHRANGTTQGPFIAASDSTFDNTFMMMGA